MGNYRNQVDDFLLFHSNCLINNVDEINTKLFGAYSVAKGLTEYGLSDPVVEFKDSTRSLPVEIVLKLKETMNLLDEIIIEISDFREQF